MPGRSFIHRAAGGSVKGKATNREKLSTAEHSMASVKPGVCTITTVVIKGAKMESRPNDAGALSKSY